MTRPDHMACLAAMHAHRLFHRRTLFFRRPTRIPTSTTRHNIVQGCRGRHHACLRVPVTAWQQQAFICVCVLIPGLFEFAGLLGELCPFPHGSFPRSLYISVHQTGLLGAGRRGRRGIHLAFPSTSNTSFVSSFPLSFTVGLRVAPRAEDSAGPGRPCSHLDKRDEMDDGRSREDGRKIGSKGEGVGRGITSKDELPQVPSSCSALYQL